MEKRKQQRKRSERSVDSKSGVVRYERARKVKIHFNRQRAPKGLPWTVHLSGQCIPAADVRILVPAETVFQPEKKANPRAWISARGIIQIEGSTVSILPESR